jgi:hypothetical protein
MVLYIGLILPLWCRVGKDNSALCTFFPEKDFNYTKKKIKIKHMCSFTFAVRWCIVMVEMENEHD